MSLILSLDLGTTKICALALDARTGLPVATLSAPNDSTLPGLARDRHEQDPRRILDIAFNLLRGLLAQPELRGRAVRAIGLAGQMHGLLLVDANLNPLTNLLTWRDERCAPLIPIWQDRLGPSAPARLGCRLSAGYGGASLAWLASQGDLPRGAHALSLAGYLAAILSGELACDPQHAASWGLYDLQARDWDLPALVALGISPALLPRLQPSALPLGPLAGPVREALGLEGETLVCSPLGDNQAGVYGLSGGDPGALVLSLGTGGQVSAPCPVYAYNPALETRPMPFSGFIQVGASLCAGWAYAYLRQFYQSILSEIGGQELDDETVYARMNALAASAGPGSLAFDTRFSGSRLEPGLRGTLSGIDTHNFTPAALTRALAEGMVAELHNLAQSAGPRDVRRVIAAGNAARKNPLLPQLITQAFGLPCEISPHREETALGAALATQHY